MAIEAVGVTKRFGDFVALDDVTVSVPDGSLTALLGPSGGGKSTLLRIIAGLEQPDTGSVMLDDADVTKRPARDRGIGFVFQHYAAFKHMSVWQNVAFGLSIRHTPKAEIKERVSELLELVHLDGFADRMPANLSGGQRQRMALARALAVQPRVLLLDEPFGALDTKVRSELRDWLRHLHAEMHVTTVFVTHDQEEAMELAEQIVVVNHGRVEQAGTPDQVYDDPANPFVMGFVGAITKIGDNYVRPHDIEIVRTAEIDTHQATVDRLTWLGFQTRAEMLLADGERVTVNLTRAHADEINLRDGDVVHLKLRRARHFPAAARELEGELSLTG
jgi:sulfate transport system ATP-binding protein